MNVNVKGPKNQRDSADLARLWWLLVLSPWSGLMAMTESVNWDPVVIQFCSPASTTTLHAWRANTAALRAKGYQGAPPIDGILFEWRAPQTRRFWMKDTPIALDLWHLNDQGQITEHVALTPYSEVIVESRSMGRYSLETPQHLNLSMQYTVGDSITWESNTCPAAVSQPRPETVGGVQTSVPQPEDGAQWP